MHVISRILYYAAAPGTWVIKKTKGPVWLQYVMLAALFLELVLLVELPLLLAGWITFMAWMVLQIAKENSPDAGKVAP